MPKPMKWRRDGTSETPKPIDIRLAGLGTPGDRLQVSSGVTNRIGYNLRKAALVESWILGGVHRESVRGVALRRFDVNTWYSARQKGTEAIETLLRESGAEPLDDLIRDYLRSSKAGDKPKMRQRLHRFASWVGKKPTVADLTTAKVDRFLSELIDERTRETTKTPAQGSTVNRYRAALSGLATWAVKNGRLQAHPIAGKKVEKREEPEHRLPEMSPDEYRDYIAHARTERPDLIVMLLLLIHTAPDVGELWTRTARDVDLAAGRIVYQRSKTRRFASARRPRMVPVPALVLAELRGHIAEHRLAGSQPLFEMFARGDLEGTHRRAAAAIKRPELTLKDLRHVAAIAWVKAGVHIRLVQRWLGHASLSQTMKYTDYEPDADAASAMAERAADTLNRSADVSPIRKEA